ncbi:hypothetical protein J9N36_004435 [Salmonella enterica]|uniref:Uncharacterized protein n=1 Tax=Salmonella newport TaxID=108619 RepID=A0A5U9VPA3_SALNE|nr:hypothetical protein [Salmonella enterica subsp. enterica serovar Newport]ECB3302031.1 hypothetical protein [Salmonella enterica subsp. enterica serovar Newport]EHI3122998.1 hypothetical protein [Salmonella enterica]
MVKIFRSDAYSLGFLTKRLEDNQFIWYAVSVSKNAVTTFHLP